VGRKEKRWEPGGKSKGDLNTVTKAGTRRPISPLFWEVTRRRGRESPKKKQQEKKQKPTITNFHEGLHGVQGENNGYTTLKRGQGGLEKERIGPVIMYAHRGDANMA